MLSRRLRRKIMKKNLNKKLVVLVTVLTGMFLESIRKYEGEMLSWSRKAPHGFFRALVPGWQDLVFDRWTLRVNHAQNTLQFQAFWNATKAYIGGGEAQVNPVTGKLQAALYKWETRERRQRLIWNGVTANTRLERGEAEMLQLVTDYVRYIGVKHYASFAKTIRYTEATRENQAASPENQVGGKTRVPAVPEKLPVIEVQTISRGLPKYRRGDDEYTVVEEHYQRYHTSQGVQCQEVAPYLRRAGRIIPFDQLL